MSLTQLTSSNNGRLENNNKSIAYESEIHNAYDRTRTYKQGDIVTEHGTIYECHLRVSAPESFQNHKWVAKDEQGGRLYDIHKNYEVGDIVVESTSATSKVWRARRSTSGHFTPNDWVQLSEQGGTEWNNATNYVRGDVVSRTDIMPVKVYVATHTSRNDQPPQTGSSTNWQALDTSMHNAQEGGDQDGSGRLSPGTYGGPQHCPWRSSSHDPADHPRTPNTLGEYPNTHISSSHSEDIGATWLVSGLGYGSNGDKNQYKMTTGNLRGLMVRDGDQLTWVGGASGSETWFHSPVPEVIGERGGLKWVSTKIYIEGDVVGKDGIQYVALRTSTNKDPSNQIGGMDTYWGVAEEGGGLVWDRFKTYPKMAIISIEEVWPSGLSFVEQFLSKDDDNKGNNPLDHNDTHWERFNAVKYIDKDITFTAGNGGDFPGVKGLLDALLFVSRFVAVDGATIMIEVKASHAVSYELNLKGVDLGAVDVIVENDQPLKVSIHNNLFINAFRSQLPRFMCHMKVTGSTNLGQVMILDQSFLKLGVDKLIDINVNSSVRCVFAYCTTSANFSLGMARIKYTGGVMAVFCEATFNSSVLTLGRGSSTVSFDGGGVVSFAFSMTNGSKCIIAYQKIINCIANGGKDSIYIADGSTITLNGVTLPNIQPVNVLSKVGTIFK